MSNPYKQLLDLLPSRDLQIGDVTAFGDGVATVELLDGGVISARGSATVGQRVYVRDGAIEGLAPSLSVVTVEI